MSLEPRCLVCGNPLDRGAPFEADISKSEVCSLECLEYYLAEDGVAEECETCGYHHAPMNCPFRPKNNSDPAQEQNAPNE